MTKKICFVVSAMICAGILVACDDAGTSASGIEEQSDKCTKNKDCSDGLVCIKHKCVQENEDECTSDKDCDKGEVCNSRSCKKDECTSDEDCAKGEVCNSGSCQIDETSCGGQTCKEDETCLLNECVSNETCGGVICGDDEYCLYGGCIQKVTCQGVVCNADEICGEAGCEKADYCIVDQQEVTRCGDNCCQVDEMCGVRNTCCLWENACGADCCASDEVCEYGICYKKCEFERCRLNDGTTTCCSEGEVCTSNQCFLPSLSCSDQYDCPENQYCDSTHMCYPRPNKAECKMNKGGPIIPTLLWNWGTGENTPKEDEYPQQVEVVSSPMVADIDLDGVPEVVFNSRKSGASTSLLGILRILDGKTGKLKAFSNPDKGQPYTDGTASLAIGDLLLDRPGLEIVTCAYVNDNQKIVAFDNKAQLIWTSNGDGDDCLWSGSVNIADFDGDGQPEVFSGDKVLDGKTGAVIAKINRRSGFPLASDIDGDGYPELITGNCAYKVNVKEKQQKELWCNANITGGSLYSAVADINLDGKPEIVTVMPDVHQMTVLKADGSLLWNHPVDVHVGNSTEYGGGAPTIANLDDTPEPEIALSSGYYYVAFDHLGHLKWSRKTYDPSKYTGSSVFDFDGDGLAEVVYNDEYFLRVYDGRTGDTRFCACNRSLTFSEYPVIVDVNADGHSEIIVSSSYSSSCQYIGEKERSNDPCVETLLAAGDEYSMSHVGVNVYSSPNQDWVNTRQIWNQYSYNITNVLDSGKIPEKAKNNWEVEGLNNYRLNSQPGASYLPDLVIRDISSDIGCTGEKTLYFRVWNDGWATAMPGISVRVLQRPDETSEYQEIGQAVTTKMIRAGEEEVLSINLDASNGMQVKLVISDSVLTECRTDNNSAEFTFTCVVN